MREFFEVIHLYPRISIGLGIYLFIILALILATIEGIVKIKKANHFNN